MSITVNLYYKGTNGSARAFAEEMESRGIADAIRAEEGNLRYEYFIPLSDPETVLLIDSWKDQASLDKHHASAMMSEIAKLRDKYDLHMSMERYVKAGVMQNKQDCKMLKRIVDACMAFLLLFLMAYQVTGEALHEWIGMGMTALVIVHQILNRRWYSAVFKGKYNSYRTVTTAVNILLLLSFIITPLSGMSMSSHAVPFMYGMAPVSLARQMHLVMSHWSFVLMGIHLGLHIPLMTAKMKTEGKAKTAISAAFYLAAGVGLVLFIRSGWLNYMFFRSAFAFLDYDKAGALVLLENLLMLVFWAFIGCQLFKLLKRHAMIEEQSESSSG